MRCKKKQTQKNMVLLGQFFCPIASQPIVAATVIDLLVLLSTQRFKNNRNLTGRSKRIYIPRSQTTHILEDLTPIKWGQLGSRNVNGKVKYSNMIISYDPKVTKLIGIFVISPSCKRSQKQTLHPAPSLCGKDSCWHSSTN